jgi:hypothetical protein
MMEQYTGKIKEEKQKLPSSQSIYTTTSETRKNL